MDVQLPQRLDEVLEAITDRGLASKLRVVIQAAAHAADHLGQLNLVKLEPTGLHETGDLSLWEKMAPAVASTVVDVIALLKVIDTHFPAGGQRAEEFESFSDDRSEAEAGMVFRAIAAELAQDVSQVGGMMRNPLLMGSGWALLGELQRLRADFRGRICDAVYLAAAACAPVSREEVVPGHAQETARAALFRSTAADVRRNVAKKLANASLTPQVLATQIDLDFDIFSTLAAWRHVRAEPKRQMLLLRERLQQSAKDAALTHTELRELVEPALGLLRTLGDEQTQRVLPTYDRTAWIKVEQLLEQVRLHIQLKTSVGAAAFARTLKGCENLYGRDPDFDDYLRHARGQSNQDLSVEQLAEQAAALGVKLAGLLR